MNLDSLRTLFTDKQRPFLVRLILLFCLGVALLVGGALFGTDDTERQVESITVAQPGDESVVIPKDERSLERRLAEVLSMVEGAGDVEVMLTFSQSREIVLAQDTTLNETSVNEEDSAGGSRATGSLSKDSRTILVQSPRGGQEPIILREIVPTVEGVIIVSEGGDNVFVREALIRAATTVLGVDIHRVQVLQMR